MTFFESLSQIYYSFIYILLKFEISGNKITGSTKNFDLGLIVPRFSIARSSI